MIYYNSDIYQNFMIQIAENNIFNSKNLFKKEDEKQR
jgi:hypothetical protein